MYIHVHVHVAQWNSASVLSASCVYVYMYMYMHFLPLSYSKPVNLGVANSPPTVLKLGGGVVLEYSNGDVCKGQQKMKTTLILNCDKDTPIVSISLILVHA